MRYFKKLKNLSISEYFQIIAEISQSKYFPNREDLNGAALALIRLQETYKLNPSDLANGQIRNVQYM